MEKEKQKINEITAILNGVEKYRCPCGCHKNSGIVHIAPCCNNGNVEIPKGKSAITKDLLAYVNLSVRQTAEEVIKEIEAKAFEYPMHPNSDDPPKTLSRNVKIIYLSDVVKLREKYKEGV